MLAKADTPAGERLDILVTLVEAYDKKHSCSSSPIPSKRSSSTWSTWGTRLKIWSL